MEFNFLKLSSYLYFNFRKLQLPSIHDASTHSLPPNKSLSPRSSIISHRSNTTSNSNTSLHPTHPIHRQPTHAQDLRNTILPRQQQDIHSPHLHPSQTPIRWQQQQQQCEFIDTDRHHPTLQVSTTNRRIRRSINDNYRTEYPRSAGNSSDTGCVGCRVCCN